MSPIQIALLLLAVAGVWAVIELALTLRKTRAPSLIRSTRR